MKKIIFLFVGVLIFLSGCVAPAEQNPTTTNLTTAETNEQTIIIDYPEFEIPQIDREILDQRMKSAVNHWIGSELEADSRIDLKGNVTLQNDQFLNVLFEGSIAGNETAHPSRIAFSVCILLDDLTVIDPLSEILIDASFVTHFRSQLPMQKRSDVTSEVWTQIVEYVNGHSDDELKASISNSRIALTEDGVIVCFNVPHAVGDYIKITVPQQIGDGFQP